MKLYAILSPKQIPIHQTILVEMAPGVSSVIADSLEGSCIRLAFQGWKQMMGQLIQCSQVPSQTTCSMCLYYFRFCCSPCCSDKLIVISIMLLCTDRTGHRSLTHLRRCSTSGLFMWEPISSGS